MTSLQSIAPAFVTMAHSINTAAVATMDTSGKPRIRMLHPVWEWDGTELVDWIATVPTPLKRAHIAAQPHVSVNYWTPSQDTCSADCAVQWVFEDEARIAVWDKIKNTPAPVGYDPGQEPEWKDKGPTSENFAAWKLTPYRLRYLANALPIDGERDVRTWRAG